MDWKHARNLKTARQIDSYGRSCPTFPHNWHCDLLFGKTNSAHPLIKEVARTNNGLLGLNCVPDYSQDWFWPFTWWTDSLCGICWDWCFTILALTQPKEVPHSFVDPPYQLEMMIQQPPHHKVACWWWCCHRLIIRCKTIQDSWYMLSIWYLFTTHNEIITNHLNLSQVRTHAMLSFFSSM